MQTKTVLVTGGAKRIGAAICRRLHAAGANLALHYSTSLLPAQALAAELNSVRPDSVALFQADLLDIAALPQLIEQVVVKFGRLDGLVNNASSFFPTPVGQINEDGWQNLIGTNLKVPLFLSQAAAPYLKQSQGWIVNMVDIHAERPMKNYVVYSIAKAGLAALTKSLARELAPNVRVNGVAPGAILWPEGNRFDEALQQEIIRHIPLQRIGTPEDIARTILFLADSPYMTGQIVAVDGGKSVVSE